MKYRYDVTPDTNGTFLITSPDFPEVTTFAETLEEAPLRAKAAISEAIAARQLREAVAESAGHPALTLEECLARRGLTEEDLLPPIEQP